MSVLLEGWIHISILVSSASGPSYFSWLALVATYPHYLATLIDIIPIEKSSGNYIKLKGPAQYSDVSVD